MRDIVAGLIAFGLLVVAASLATTLHFWRLWRRRAYEAERRLGRAIVAEIPSDNELTLFSEDEARFYYRNQSIDKDLIAAARVLINGSPIAAVTSTRHARTLSTASASGATRGERLRLAPRESSRGAASGDGAPRAVDDAAPATPDWGAVATGVIDDRPEGIARDRWDVAIETAGGTIVVECGAIRERISQELARAVFDAVKRDVERRNEATG